MGKTIEAKPHRVIFKVTTPKNPLLSITSGYKTVQEKRPPMPFYWMQSHTHSEKSIEVENPHTIDLSKASFYPPPLP